MLKPPKIYFDTVSTTKIDNEVLETYQKLLNKYYYNSDALYDDGVAVYRLQEESRKNIAKLLNIKNNEIIFTSGASEANSMAIKGLAFNRLKKGLKGHIITSIYEHSSVYNAIKQLETIFGFEVTYLYPDEDGQIDPLKLDHHIKNDTFLVSIMYVNNELGVINNIKKIKEVVKRHSGVVLHSDMTQALAKTDIDLSDVDMASFSAHKIHGLKGSGFLYKKAHIEIEPLISGGQQEFKLRGGTSNAPSNIVLAKTLRLALNNYRKYHTYIKELHDYLIRQLKSIDVIINSPLDGLSGIINLSTRVKSEVCLNALNQKGIMVSSRSTCGSRENEPSRVLSCMRIDDEYAIRISLDYHNTKEEIDYFIISLKEIIEKYAC